MADTKITDDPSAGTLTGAEIVPVVRGAGSPTAYAHYRTTVQTIADLAATVPTIASTGFATWVNQGSATIADSATGVVMAGPDQANVQNLRLRSKTAPATPYTITALFALTPAEFAAICSLVFGWYDGTKVQTIELSQRDSGATPVLYVNSYSTVGVFNTSHFAGSVTPIGHRAYLRIADDGTTVSFQWSADGANFQTFYSIAKASGYLANYNTLVWGISPYAAAIKAVMMSYGEG